MVFASQIVQVTSEAKASPIMDRLHHDVGIHEHVPGRQLRGSSATSVAASAALGQGSHAAAPHQRIITFKLFAA